MNRMNGSVGPVRPMQNNRQMGRVNGGPYPNGAGKHLFEQNFKILFKLNKKLNSNREKTRQINLT